jgi:hypothetical protein
VRSRAEKTSPQAALDFFNAMPPAERSLGAWYEAGRAMTALDTESASQWMAGLPGGPERDAAATALVESLTSTGGDRPGTNPRPTKLDSRWILPPVPPPGSTYMLMTSLASTDEWDTAPPATASRTDPGGRDAEAAFHWAADMSGETERLHYLTVAARAWALQDAGAAREAVAAANLPEAARQQLLLELAKGGAP